MSSVPAGEKVQSKKTMARALASASVIGTLFFSWAAFVNWGHGLEQAARAGAGQGSVSFVMSLFMTFMLEYFLFLPGINRSLRIPIAVAATMSIVLGAAALVHVLIGTPEIIKTITLPFVMGVGYTGLYSFRLSRMEAFTVRVAVGDNGSVPNMTDMSSMPADDKASGKKTVTRALASATVIGSLFFLWYASVNWEHGPEPALRAGAVQGAVSFSISLCMALMLEFFFFLPGMNRLLRIPVAVASTLAIVIGAVAVVYVLIDTPGIIKAMALPFVMGVAYAGLYSFRLSRVKNFTSRGALDDKAAGKKTIKRVLVSAVLLGGLFFSWTTFVGWEQGLEHALLAGAAKGSVFFLISLCAAMMLEFFFFLPGINKALRIPFTVTATLFVIIALASVHILAGSPEVIETMVMPFSMSVGYTILYSFRLSRMDVSAVMSAVGEN